MEKTDPQFFLDSPCLLYFLHILCVKSEKRRLIIHEFKSKDCIGSGNAAVSINFLSV